MLRCSAILALLWALMCDSARPAEPAAQAAASEQIPIFMPDSPAVPGRTRPDGLLCILGDDRLRLSGYPTRIIPTLDGKRLFGVSTTNVVDIIDAKTLTVVESIRASDARVMEVATSPDGKRLAVASLDGAVAVWNVSSTPAVRVEQYDPFDNSARKSVWLNLSTSLARTRFCISADSGLIVYQWEPTGLKTIYTQKEDLSFKPGLISPDGGRLIVRTKNPGEIRLLDLTSSPAKILDRMEAGAIPPADMRFKDDDTFLAASSTHSSNASYAYSIAGDKLSRMSATNDIMADGFRTVSFLDQGRLCVGSQRTGGAAVFDCSSEPWKVMQTFPRTTSGGPFLLGGAADGSVLYGVYDQALISFARTGDRFTELPSPESPVRRLSRIDNLAFLRDGTLIFSAQDAVYAVALDEPTKPRPLPPIRFRKPLRSVRYLIPHPTEREFVVVADYDPEHLIQVRDQGSALEEIRRFEFGNGPDAGRVSPWSAGYTPDGTKLAVGFWDQSIQIYDNRRGGLELLSTKPQAAGGHVCVLTFAPDGRALACGDFSNNARVFDFDGELKTETVLPRFGAAVRNAQFNSDGSQVVFGSQRGEIRVVNLAEKPPTSRSLMLPGEVEPKDEADGGVTSMSWVADGKLLMTAKGRNGETQVVLWKMPAGEPIQSWTFTGFMHAAIDRDGFMVAVARSDGTVCVMQVSEQVQRWLSDAPSS